MTLAELVACRPLPQFFLSADDPHGGFKVPHFPMKKLPDPEHDYGRRMNRRTVEPSNRRTLNIPGPVQGSIVQSSIVQGSVSHPHPDPDPEHDYAIAQGRDEKPLWLTICRLLFFPAGCWAIAAAGRRINQQSPVNNPQSEIPTPQSPNPKPINP